MKIRITAALVLMSVALAPAAFSREPDSSGFYVGAGVGSFNAQIDDINQIDDTIDKWNEDDTAYKVFAGFRLNRFLSFEADYINLGKPSGSVVPGVNVDSSVDGFAPYVIGTIPIGQHFEVFGRLGYYFYDANLRERDTLNGDVRFDEESEDLVWGGGVGVIFGERFNLRFEYERFDLQRLDDADALWLTAAWRF